MSVREFKDEQGREWRAWDIRPDAIHPQTKAEDYLAECYDVGWIVFETAAADEKRRLCPYPKRWAEATEPELLDMLARADAVPPHKLAAERRTIGESAAAPAPVDTPDITDLVVVRSFRYPGGRIWTVCQVPHPENGGPPVLRFTAGMRTVDLKTWPKDWADAPESRLGELLRLAMPRPPAPPPGPDTPRRRQTDR
jgi:hypothetical protein